MKLRKITDKPLNKRGVVSGIVTGMIGLIFTVVIGYVLIDTVLGAGLLTTGGAYDNSANNLATNLTTGIGAVGNKIPTILLISAVVLLFGALALLIFQAQKMGMFGGAGGGL